MDRLLRSLTPGIRDMLLAGLFFAVMQGLIRGLENVHVFQIVFFRSGVTALLAIFLLRRKGLSLKGNKQGLLLLRALFGVTSMTLFFFTLQRMPLGASVALKYLSPLFAAVFAVLLLKEKVRPLSWVLFMVALGGVALLKGFDGRIEPLNLVLSVSGALFGGLVYVTIRRIGDTEHPLVIINYFMLSATILSGVAMIPVWQTPSLPKLAILLTVGGLGYFAQMYMTRSFQREKASRVAPFKYMEVTYALLIGLVFFEESYPILSLLGILLIIIAMLGNLLLRRVP